MHLSKNYAKVKDVLYRFRHFLVVYTRDLLMHTSVNPQN